MSALLSDSLMSLHTENQTQYLLVLNFAGSLLINFQVLLTAFPFKREKNVIILNSGSLQTTNYYCNCLTLINYVFLSLNFLKFFLTTCYNHSWRILIFTPSAPNKSTSTKTSVSMSPLRPLSDDPLPSTPLHSTRNAVDWIVAFRLSTTGGATYPSPLCFVVY
jgi:hypothetical protein